jgi:hypothetical protein
LSTTFSKRLVVSILLVNLPLEILFSNAVNCLSFYPAVMIMHPTTVNVSLRVSVPSSGGSGGGGQRSGTWTSRRSSRPRRDGSGLL